MAYKPDGRMAAVDGKGGGKAKSATGPGGGHAGCQERSSAEFDFSEHMRAKPEYRRRGTDDVYRWTGERWVAVDRADGHVRATEWLAENRRESCSAAKARSAWDTATLRMPELRLLSEAGRPRYIVPTENLWLEIEIDRDRAGRPLGGRIRKVAPDMEAGVTGGVPVRIEGKAGEEYVPSPLPRGSLFSNFLSSSFPRTDPDAVEALEAIQEYAGYTIIPGSPNEQVAHIWHGQGGNGKGVLKALIAKFHAKAASVDPERLDGFGLQPLVDATLAMVDEMPRQFSPERLKSLISGDPVCIDRKYKDMIDFRCGARWIINSNQDFGVRTADASAGFFRRFIIIEWKAAPAPSERIAGLEDSIFGGEAGAVLDWLLTGLLRYLGNGFLLAPAASNRLKAAAMEAADSVLSWSAEVGGATVLAPIHEPHASRAEVYAHYCEHCSRSGRQAVSDTVFWRRLRTRWGDALNPEVSETRKGGVYRRMTNIDLSRGTGTAAPADTGARPRARKATMEDLYGFQASPPAHSAGVTSAPSPFPILADGDMTLDGFEGLFMESLLPALDDGRVKGPWPTPPPSPARAAQPTPH